MKIEYVIADREGWYELILHCNSESGLFSLSLKLPRAGRMISTHDDDDGKRPVFPSGVTCGLRTTMSSWLMGWKRSLVAGLAGSERCLRSGGLQS